MLFYVLLGLVVLCVSGLIYGVSMLVGGDNGQIEDRLQSLTKNGGRGLTATDHSSTSVLKSPLDAVPNALEEFLSKFLNVRRMIDQSGMEFSVTHLALVSLGLGSLFAVVYFVASPIKSVTPLLFFVGAILPLGYVWWVRRRRMKRFGAQLPEAMDLICQALRAGQSLPSGIHLVSTQMADPIGPEFAKAYEQQNLGVPLEQSLLDMTTRIDNLDFQFFSTAVILQRQTGGDLAEILDKIGKLTRERFQIHGQIQALTGEGRLSGIVLLALPPTLFITMLKLNYDYVMLLFNDPLGQKMLMFGIIMQVLGALWIKKVITIKV